MATIDVILALGPKSEPFADLACQLYRHLESGKHTIRYRGIKGGVEYPPNNIEIIDSVEVQPGPGDLTHAEVLKRAMRHIESDFTLLCDADVAVLSKNWDDICVQEIEGNVAAMGFQIPDNRCKIFPCVRFIMFDSNKLKECNPEFEPILTRGKRAHPIKKHLEADLAEVMGFSVGAAIYADTGWKMPAAFYSKGYEGIVMPFVRPKNHVIPALSDEQKRRLRCRILGHEEYLWKNKLFGAHKGQIRRGFDEQGLWESRVIAFAEKTLGFKYRGERRC
jgi:hypothetical protein